MIRLRRKQIVLDDIKRIHVSPGDALLFTCSKPLSPDEAKRIKAVVEAAIPGIRALVTSKDDFDVTAISVERPADLPPAPPADTEVRG